MKNYTYLIISPLKPKNLNKSNFNVISRSIALFLTVICFLLSSYFSSAQISRAQIINNASPYTSFSWTASSCNLWSGKSCGGRNVYSADIPWVNIGINVSMPYCWGGWSTRAEHNTAMANCKSAGDICSLSGGGCSGGGAGLSCASGHDCSGLISRAWGLSSKQSTSTLPSLSTSIPLSQVQPGDILNVAGSHTRLVETNYGNGNYRVIEASGTDWKTAYHTYTAAQLASYDPRCPNANIVIGGCSSGGAPSNDNCPGTSITSNGACISGTVAGATSSYGANRCNGCNCTSPDDKDVYYYFAAQATSHTVTVSNYASNFDAVIELRTACSYNTSLGCYDPTGVPTSVSYTWNNLTIGQTYYIRIFEYNYTGTPPSSPTFQVCVTHASNALPDLKISTGTQSANPSSVAAGSNITAYCSEDNSGTTSAGANHVTLWLSSNNILIESQDIKLGQIAFPTVPALSNTAVLNTSVQIPPNINPGNYYLFFWADGNKVVTESNEENNFASTQISVTSALTVSPSSLTLGAASGSNNQISVSSNVSWTASDNASWLSVSPSSGSNNGTVTVTATSENTSTNPRSGTVTISGNGITRTVSVTQNGAASTLTITPSSLSLGAASGSNDQITVSSNVSWSASDNASWLSVSPSSGSNNGTVTVTATSENTSTNPRSATVTISGNGITRTVSVTQNGTAASLTVSPSNLSLASVSGSNDQINVSSNISWSASDNASWLSVSPSNGSNNRTVTVTATSENTSTNSRSATVTISGSGITRTISVTQNGAAASLTVSPSNLSLASASGSNDQISLSSNVNWSASDNASWLSVSPSSGSNNGTITVTATSENTSTNSRSATVTISGNGITRTVSVSQQPAPCSEPTSPSSATASQTTITAGQSTTLQINGGELNDAPNWVWYIGGCGGTQVGTRTSLSVSPTSTTTYYVQASACGISTTCRSVTITVNPCVTPAITSQPVDVSVTSPNGVNFSIEANGSNNLYQWQYSQGFTWQNLSNNSTYSGVNTATLNISATSINMNGYQYRCHVSSSCISTNLNSSPATLLVTEPCSEILTPSVSISANPSEAICSGQNVIFTATSINGGTSPIYQWKRNGINVSSGITYSSSSLENGDVITCEMTSNAPCVNPATASESLTVSVMPVVAEATQIIISSGVNPTCIGESVTYTTPNIDGASSYVWTLVSGAIINSESNSISVNYTNSVTGTIKVKGQNACSEGLETALQVVVNPAYQIYEERSICQGDSYQGWESSGQYQRNLISGSGCDSVVTTYLTVYANPEKPTIKQVHDTLISSAVSGNQWCKNDIELLGENNQKLIVSESGEYHTFVTNENGCKSEVSDKLHVIPTNNQVYSLSQIKVYPNPTTGIITIEGLPENEKAEIAIYDMNGSVIKKLVSYSSVFQIDIKNVVSGSYLLIINGDIDKAVKIIKE